jgi:hypothetical protein
MGLSSNVLNVEYYDSTLLARNMVRLFSSTCRGLFLFIFIQPFESSLALLEAVAAHFGREDQADSINPGLC